MKVLHIGKYFAPFKGGVESYLQDVMGGLGKHGITCAALVHNHERAFKSVSETLGPDERPYRVLRSSTWATTFFTPVSPGFRRDLSELIRDFGPDVIHVHLPNPSVFWLMSLHKARSIPLVVHWHSDVITKSQGPLLRLLYRFYRPLERRLLEKASAIIATSESYLQSSESLGAFPEKCHVVPLGLDPFRIDPDDLAASAWKRREEDPEKGPFRVLAIGRLTYYKGFGYLIRALAELDNVELHIVGQGGLRRELRLLARQLQVASRVHFRGGLSDEELVQELLRCDCVCLPSIERTEAFGLVLLEAMLFSRATVASNVRGSGMSWVVRDAQTGLKVKPKDVASLVVALARLRDEPELKRRLGEGGRQRFDEEFHIDRSVRALTSVYDAVRPGEGAS